jgi:hypothetical protein
MSDPRYTDPQNDPRRPGANDPIDPAPPRRLDLEDDSGRGTMWAWIVGIIAIIVVAMLLYDYNRPISTTADNPPNTSSPSTTGAAPPAPPRINPAAPTPAPAIPAPLRLHLRRATHRRAKNMGCRRFDLLPLAGRESCVHECATVIDVGAMTDAALDGSVMVRHGRPSRR